MSSTCLCQWAFILEWKWIVLVSCALPEQSSAFAKSVGLLDWLLSGNGLMMDSRDRFVGSASVIDAHVSVERMWLKLSDSMSQSCRAFIVDGERIVLVSCALPEQASDPAKSVGLLDWLLSGNGLMMDSRDRFVGSARVVEAHMCVGRM